MDKIWQEIHCTTSGGGCGGYVLVGLNKHLNHIVHIICPKCGHKHQRKIQNGHVMEKDRFTGQPIEEVCPTIAAWTEKPRTSGMKKLVSSFRTERDGAIVDGSEVFLDQQMKELWEEHHGGGES